MTERELRRTALIIPPRGRAVLCCWAAIPGLLAAPFVFWQSLFAGLCFCAVWGLLVLALRLRACSFVAALSPRSLTVQENGEVFVQAKENEAEPAKETFLDFPEKVYWPQLVKVLEEEGYAADARDADILVSW